MYWHSNDIEYIYIYECFSNHGTEDKPTYFNLLNDEFSI